MLYVKGSKAAGCKVLKIIVSPSIASGDDEGKRKCGVRVGAAWKDIN